MYLKALPIISLCIAACLFPGCGKDEPETVERPKMRTYLRTDKDTCRFGSKPQADTLSISSNSTWKVSVSESGSEWVSVSPESGVMNGTVIVSIARNNAEQDRTAELFLVSQSSDRDTVRIFQQARPAGSVVSCNYPRDMVFMQAGNEWAMGEYTTDRLLKYLVTKDNQWFFDGFAMTCDYLGGENDTERRYFSVRTDCTRTTQEDWETLLDYYINKTLRAYDEATKMAIAQIGTERTTKIVIMIPWPSQGQMGWGTIDGETINFTDNATKVKVMEWWIDRVIEKWRSANFEKLELVGFYWLHEALGMNDTELIDVATVQKVADYIHTYDTELYWCPYFNIYAFSDARINKWKEYHIDRPTYQTNYYFRDVDSSRLKTACDNAHAAGLGLEFEFDWKTTCYDDYLAKAIETVKAFDEYGVWENDIMSYYHGYRALEDIAASTDPKRMEFYDMLASHVAARQKKVYGF